MRRTKIVATIGPAGKTPRMVAGMIGAGVDAFRINMSHSTSADLADRVNLVRRLASEANATVAVLVDLAGPKVRLGEIVPAPVELGRGSVFRLVREPVTGDATRASTNHPGLVDDMAPGQTLLIDDGLVRLRVDSKSDDELVCEVVVGGPISSHKGVAAPGARLSTECLTEKDRSDLAAAVELGVDWVAMSFVRRAADIDRLRELLPDDVPVMGKIELAEAVEAIDEIIAAADGVMVARGDLGVDLPSEDVPVAQKGIISSAIAAGKPVVTATQMLDSMIRNPRPTRAEASDVANAVFDGSDALMLSGETAIGAYPVESVKTMARVIEKAERAPWFATARPKIVPREASVTDAISAATCRLAADLGAAAIVTSTESGHTARAVARYRPDVPIVAVSPKEEVARRLVLSRGVVPLQVKPSSNIDDMLDRAARATVEAGIAGAGDMLVITAGVLVNRPGTTNMIKVHRL